MEKWKKLFKNERSKITEKTVYKTGVMDDPGLTERLYESGATFAKDIEKTMSPLLSIFLTVVLPMLIFIGLGQYMSKKLMEQTGGKKCHGYQIWYERRI